MVTKLEEILGEPLAQQLVAKTKSENMRVTSGGSSYIVSVQGEDSKRFPSAAFFKVTAVASTRPHLKLMYHHHCHKF